MADSDTTQQVTSKRVAAGNAEITRQAREAHKKLLAEAQVIIANSQLKRAETPVDTLSAEPPPKKGINYIITKALSDLYGNLPRDCFLAVARAMEKHVDFSHDSDGYPIDEVDNAEQSSANAE